MTTGEFIYPGPNRIQKIARKSSYPSHLSPGSLCTLQYTLVAANRERMNTFNPVERVQSIIQLTGAIRIKYEEINNFVFYTKLVVTALLLLCWREMLCWDRTLDSVSNI